MDIDINKSDFNKTIAPWLGKTSKMMHSYIAAIFQVHNLNVTREQWIVLKILHEDRDGFVQNDLAYISNRNKASMTRLIDVMEKNNLVVRIPSKEDSRKKLIYITKTGKLIFTKTKPLLLTSIKLIEENISQNEMEVFISIMKKIQNNIKKYHI